VDKRLREYLNGLNEVSKRYHPFMGLCADKSREYVLRGGRRIMSCGALLTYEGYTGKIDEQVLDLCVAIELYRHAILIHDDLADEDDTRRGGRAFHKLFVKEYDERFGDRLAIFYGNILFARSLSVIKSSGMSKGMKEEMIGLFVESYRAVNESQILDMLFEYTKPTVREWEIMASNRASPLFGMILTAGAMLGGAPEDEVKILTRAGGHIGLSFDIQDDIIGTFATEEQYGRAVGGDVLLGKKPLHVVYAYELAGEDDLKRLEQVLKKGSKQFYSDEERIKTAKEIISRCGALDRAKETSRYHAKKAIELIKSTSMGNGVKDSLTGFIDFISESLDWYN
jgi:geranylgeranyl diphosphate synthase type II